jgi:hypothetical protein
MIFLRIFRRLNRDLIRPWAIFEKFWFFSLNVASNSRKYFFVDRYLQKKLTFILVLFDGFLVGYWNFDSLYSKIAINLFVFWLFMNVLASTILSLAEPMRDQFHCWLSRVCLCSAGVQILTVFTKTSGVMISQCRTNFITVWVKKRVQVQSS